jgi:hypothetical protein
MEWLTVRNTDSFSGNARPPDARDTPSQRTWSKSIEGIPNFQGGGKPSSGLSGPNENDKKSLWNVLNIRKKEKYVKVERLLAHPQFLLSQIQYFFPRNTVSAVFILKAFLIE